MPSFLCLPSVRCRLAFTLAITAITIACHPSAHAVACHVAPVATPSPAEEAYLKGNFDHAATLYQSELTQHENDPIPTIGLVQVLLRQQKVKEASDLVQKALAAHPVSVELLTALGEVQFRQGTIWLVGATIAKANQLDPCYPRLRLLAARFLRLNSMYGGAAREVETAHRLAPHDPRIRRQWLNTLPIKERIADLENYLASSTGDDPNDIRNLRQYLDYLKRESEQPHKACRLVSNTDSTAIPFARIMYDASHVRAYGLDVKLNDHSARLQIDTGAGGIVISRSVANRSGLQRFSQSEVGGIGDQGRKPSYTAFADDIKIGALEFRDCAVEVIDQSNVVDIDGLIGMDVLSRFLVTLDYPMRKLILGPLPPRPDDVAPAKPTLQTSSSPEEDDDDKSDAPSTSASAPAAKPAPRGPRDRYIAPEMKDWTPVYRSGHNLLVPAFLNRSGPRLFILDTGAFATSVTPSVAREVTKVHVDDRLTIKGISGKVDKVYSADEITFQFANLSQKVQDVVAFDSPSLSRSLGMDVSGLIGITALGQVTMSIDYRDGLVKFVYDANRGYKFDNTR